MTGPVHFIHVGGELRWQHVRAMYTAQVHGAPIWLHSTSEPPQIIPPSLWSSELHFSVERRLLYLPAWLDDLDVPLSAVKDLCEWRILYEHGGICLDLDTISLRPAWDLLGDGDVCVSSEYPPKGQGAHPYNNAVVIGRRKAPILSNLADACEAVLRYSHLDHVWGETGPHLLTYFADQPGFRAAPYLALSGWSYHSIGDYYNRPHDPGGNVRVIHLYSSDNLDSFLTDTWTPTT